MITAGIWMCGSVGSPQPRDFQPVFDEFATHVEMFGNLKRGLSLKHESSERREWNKGCGTSGVRSLFISLSVVSRDSSTIFVFGYNFETARLVSEKDVRNLLHQGSVRPATAVSGIQYDDPSTVGQWA
jgi:hypothetical protein